MADIFDMADTWNAGGTTFTAIKMNVTDTASAAASLLIDLQVGGSSKFAVDKSGAVEIGGNLIDGPSFWDFGANGSRIARVSNLGLTVDGALALGAALNAGNTVLDYDANDTLALRRGVNAQKSRLYNTYTDASNYERLGISWSANVVSIKPEAAGTGTARDLHISGLPTSNPGPGILWNNAGTPAIGT